MLECVGGTIVQYEQYSAISTVYQSDYSGTVPPTHSNIILAPDSSSEGRKTNKSASSLQISNGKYFIIQKYRNTEICLNFQVNDTALFLFVLIYCCHAYC